MTPAETKAPLPENVITQTLTELEHDAAAFCGRHAASTNAALIRAHMAEMADELVEVKQQRNNYDAAFKREAANVITLSAEIERLRDAIKLAIPGLEFNDREPALCVQRIASVITSLTEALAPEQKP